MPERLRERWPLALLAWAAVWTLPGLISAGQLGLSYALRGDDPPRLLLLQLTLPVWYVWGLLAPVILWAARRFPVDGPRRGRALAVHFALNAALALVSAVGVVVLQRTLGLPAMRDPAGQLVEGIGTSLLVYWGLVLVSHAARFHADARSRSVRAAELGRELADARLHALKAQLHPHFLFNGLHAATAFVRDDPARAEALLTELADLLRRALDSDDAHHVHVEEELDFVRAYLSIQQVRLAERLATEVTVDPDARGARVPAMILQPLVENAVEHGVATRRTGGTVEVDVARRGTRLRMRVRDDGPGLGGDGPGPTAARVGLTNTRERLAHHYGPDHRFEIGDRNGGGVEVLVEIPFEPGKGDG